MPSLWESVGVCFYVDMFICWVLVCATIAWLFSKRDTHCQWIKFTHLHFIYRCEYECVSVSEITLK